MLGGYGAFENAYLYFSSVFLGRFLTPSLLQAEATNEAAYQHLGDKPYLCAAALLSNSFTTEGGSAGTKGQKSLSGWWPVALATVVNTMSHGETSFAVWTRHGQAIICLLVENGPPLIDDATRHLLLLPTT